MSDEKAESVVVNVSVKFIRSPRCKNLEDWINTEGQCLHRLHDSGFNS